MSSMVSRRVEDLPDASREGIELLLGTKLHANERVYIVVESSLTGPAEPVRFQAAKRNREIIARAQANADRRGVSQGEFDEAIDEAMQHFRRRT